MKEDLYDKIVRYLIENQNKFYRLAYSYVKNEADALDVVQNAICKALEHYEKLRNEEAIKTWFYRILVHESLMILNKKKKEIPKAEQYEGEVYHEKRYEPEEDLYEKIDELEKDVQSIIRLRFFEELSLKEISEVTKINLNTVKAKLYRGLRELRQNIQEVMV